MERRGFKVERPKTLKDINTVDYQKDFQLGKLQELSLKLLHAITTNKKSEDIRASAKKLSDYALGVYGNPNSGVENIVMKKLIDENLPNYERNPAGFHRQLRSIMGEESPDRMLKILNMAQEGCSRNIMTGAPCGEKITYGFGDLYRYLGHPMTPATIRGPVMHPVSGAQQNPFFTQLDYKLQDIKMNDFFNNLFLKNPIVMLDSLSKLAGRLTTGEFQFHDFDQFVKDSKNQTLINMLGSITGIPIQPLLMMTENPLREQRIKHFGSLLRDIVSLVPIFDVATDTDGIPKITITDKSVKQSKDIWEALDKKMNQIVNQKKKNIGRRRKH